LTNAVGPINAVAAAPAAAPYVDVRRTIFKAWILFPRA
jgi:hypothetical protein